MRFMMLMIPVGYESAEPGTMPDPEAVETMEAYNRALQEAGVLLALDGLHPPSMGVRVSFEGGAPSGTDGPFAEVKEVVGGYWMIDVRSKADAGVPAVVGVEHATRRIQDGQRIRVHGSDGYDEILA